MRRLVVCTALVLAIAGVGALEAAPAGAGICFAGAGHGDARIRRGTDPYVGNLDYDCDTQIAAAEVSPGEKARFDVRVRNDTSTTKTMRLGSNPDDPGLKVRFFRAGREITDKMRVDPDFDKLGKAFRDVAVGASTPPVRMVVKAKGTAAPGLHQVDVAGFVGANFLRADFVHADVTVV